AGRQRRKECSHMTREPSRSLRAAFVNAAALIAIGVASAHAHPAPAQETAKTAGAKAPGPDIVLTQPAAPKTGANTFEVTIKESNGKPLNGADVIVVLVMPKTARMAEMRNEVKLKPGRNGIYTGAGNVLMAGGWNATVVVKKGGKEIGQ